MCLLPGPRIFVNDALERCGPPNPFEPSDDRYPKVPVEEITSSSVDIVVLPDEPYEFSANDGPESFGVCTALIPGRALTWYGPTLLNAREQILSPILAQWSLRTGCDGVSQT